MKFTLPISPEYVAHWGLWEAVREIYQNALDEGGAKLTYNEWKGLLEISTETGHLTPQSLVLGTSSKRDDETKRGKFGEGYKLALLVLARMQHSVTIYNGEELWIPSLEYDDQFNADILTIHTENSEGGTPGVIFNISGVTPEQYADIQRNIRPEIIDRILDEPQEAGRIYVGGLYVSTVKRFRHGYVFRPGIVKLDRDRGMVDGFDLAWQTSKLWTSRGHSARLSELLEAEAPDVEYVESHVSEGSNFAGDHYVHYVTRHGDAIPVSNQDEIQRAQTAGVKWVLVPEKVKSMLRLVKSWFIPSMESPLERLRKFRSNYQWSMDSNMKHDLDEIINQMDPTMEKSNVL
jgi:hypothetical protein